MKKVSLLLTLFAAFAFFMVSCGGSETPKAEASATPEVEQAEETAEPAAAEQTEEATEPAAEEATESTEEATESTDAEVTVNLENGKAIYGKMCNACHGAGIAGAAKLDDKARWEETAAKGIATIDANAIKGFTGDHGVMPPKGGMATFSDQDVKDAVAYMLDQAGVTAK